MSLDFVKINGSRPAEETYKYFKDFLRNSVSKKEVSEPVKIVLILTKDMFLGANGNRKVNIWNI